MKELDVTRIAAIKIDVEGAELQVMEGLKTNLTFQRPTIIFEVLPNFSGIGERTWHEPEARERNRASAKKIYALLRDIGYQKFQIDENTCHESIITDFDLDKINDFKGSNFIAHAT